MNRYAKLILIVEDDSALRTVLARHVEALGFLTLLAGSVGEALDRLMIRPALVLLDLGLPDASGWEVARRSRHLSRDVPVIVLSGHAPDARRMAQAGLVAYVRKPVDMRTLGHLIREHVAAPEGPFGA